MKHVSAAQYGLFLKTQILIAYGTGFLLIKPFQGLFLDFPPLILTQGKFWFLYEAQTLSKGKLFYVVDSFFLDVVIGEVIFVCVIFQDFRNAWGWGLLMVVGKLMVDRGWGSGLTWLVFGLFLRVQVNWTSTWLSRIKLSDLSEAPRPS